MKKSTPVCPVCGSEKSLCGSCAVENLISNKDWNCNDFEKYSFLNQCIFCEGRHLCVKGANPDCIYRYGTNKIAAIEIKDQPENSIEYSVLVKKIKNYYNSSIEKKLCPTIFILLVSSIKNVDGGLYSLQSSCEYGLGKEGFSIGNEGRLFSLEDGLSHIDCRFFVAKCSDFSEDLFLKLL